MSNPRKFSEKIAMHAQKQAEGTAAFEAILKEVSATTRAALAKRSANFQLPPATSNPPSFMATTVAQQMCQLPVATSHSLVEQRSPEVYRGRSLPNVNQMALHNSIDLQKALSSLENMKHEAMGRSTSTSSRCIEKIFPRNQAERSSSHPRKHFSLTRHRDCSPYGSVYLSPPNDPSWRRVSSDSAIHSNVAGSQSHCGSKFVLNADHVNSSDNITVDFGGFPRQPGNTQLWQVPDGSIVGRPKSCDVPGINIYPSPELTNTGGMAIAVAMQQTPPTASGSLPNLNKNSLQVGMCNQITIERDPGGDGVPQYGSVYVRHGQPGSRLQRHTIPAPLVIKDSNFIVMDTNSLVYENAMLLSGQSSQVSSSLNQSSYSNNSSSFALASEVSSPFSQQQCNRLSTDQLQPLTSPSQVTANLNSQSVLQYQQPQQLIFQHYQLLQQQTPIYSQKQTNSSDSPSSLSQSSPISLSSPIQVVPPSNSQPLLHAVLAQGLNIQQQQYQHFGRNSQVTQEVDYGSMSFNFSSDAAPKLDAQHPLRGHFFPIQNLSSQTANDSQTQIILASNVLAEAAARQQAAVAAAVARNNSLYAKGFVTNIMPLTNSPESQKIIYSNKDFQQSHTNILQQKFKQISVGKNLSLDYSLDGITLQPLSPSLANIVLVQNTDSSNWVPPSFATSSNNNSFYNNNNNNIMLDNAQRSCELIMTTATPSIQHQQTSVNMSVIPDIILTDFVGVCQERHQDSQMCQQFQSPDDCKDALNALSYLSDAFEGEIFTSEDALKLALDPLEMEELQMLADSTVFTDPATEDSFRLDRP